MIETTTQPLETPPTTAPTEVAKPGLGAEGLRLVKSQSTPEQQTPERFLPPEMTLGKLRSWYALSVDQEKVKSVLESFKSDQPSPEVLEQREKMLYAITDRVALARLDSVGSTERQELLQSPQPDLQLRARLEQVLEYFQDVNASKLDVASLLKFSSIDAHHQKAA